MNADDFEDGFRVRARRTRKQRKHRSRRPWANSILRRMRWLDGLLVYWAGPAGADPKDAPGLRGRILQSLAGRPPGLYTARPAGEEVARVSAELVAQARFNLDRCGHAQRGLARRVGDIAVWRGRVRRRLNYVAGVLRGLEEGGAAALVVEERCLWLGAEEARPSARVTDAELGLLTRRGGPGCRAGGFLMARRQTLSRAGHGRFPLWPLDLVCHVGGEIRGPLALADGVQELLLRDRRADVAAFLDAAELIADEVGRFRDESPRRVGIVFQCFEEAGASEPPLWEHRSGWRWNHSFLRVARKRAAAKFLVRDPYKKRGGSLRQCLRVAFGMEVPDDWRPNPRDLVAVHGPATLDVLRRMFDEAAPRHDPAILESLSRVVFTAFGRMAGRDAESTALAITAWLEACRRRVPPGNGGLDGLAVAAEVLARTDSDRALAMLGRYADEVLPRHAYPKLVRERFGTGWLRFLDGLGACPDEQTAWLFRQQADWLPALCELHAGQPDRLGPCLEVMAETFDHLPPNMKEGVLEVLRDLPATTVDRLLGLYRGLLRRRFMVSEAMAVVLETRQRFHDPRRVAWFERHFDLFPDLIHRAERAEGRAALLTHFRSTLQLADLAYYWATGGDRDELFDFFLPELRRRRFFPWPQAYGTQVAMSGFDLERLRFYLYSDPDARDDMHRGWWACRRLGGDELGLFLGEHGACKERFPRLKRMLVGVARLARIGDVAFLCGLFGEWRAARAEGSPDEWLARLRTMAGEPPEHPEIAKARRRPDQLRRERDALAARDAAPERLAKLNAWLADAAALAAWVERDVAKLVAKRLPLASFRALEAGVDARTRALTPVGEGGDEKDWVNAWQFSMSVDSNRRIMKRLMRSLQRDGGDYIGRHPLNQAFLAELKQGRPNAWLVPRERRLEVAGEVWRVYTETDPLKVLQMGNLFDTCLSVGGINAHSAVANAVEVNKRVLYMRNHKGDIVGRKLIVLTRRGEILPFTSYGAGDVHGPGHRPWIKIGLDLLCADIAAAGAFQLVEDVGAWDAEEEKMTQQYLQVFADWYYDFGEAFDWWVLHLARRPDADREELLAELRRRLTAGAETEAGPSVAMQHGRLLLWLGERGEDLDVPEATREWLAEQDGSSGAAARTPGTAHRSRQPR